MRGLLVWGFTAVVLSWVFDLAGWTVPWDADDVRDLDDAWARRTTRPTRSDARGRRATDRRRGDDPMSWVDVFVVLLALAAAISGWRQGSRSPPCPSSASSAAPCSA